MKFLHPTFLYALVFLSVPIIIHLFNFRKAVKVYFSNTRFLKNIKESTNTRRQLKHYLVLASRLLFLLFLILAFAQPFIPSGVDEPEAENVYIYLDNSMSMSNQVSNEGRAFDLALNFVDQITRNYEGNTNYKLLTNDFAPSSHTFKTRDEIQEQITETELSHVSRTLPEVYARLMHTSNKNEKGHNDIYIISDFQKSTTGALETWVTDTSASHFVVPIEFYNKNNVYVDSVFLATPFLMAEEQNVLNVVLRNTGAEPVEDLMIRLFVNDIQTANASIDIPARALATAEFRLSYRLDPINQCRISFEDFPVSFDNDFYFVLRLEDKVNILELKEVDKTSPIESVYANQGIFQINSQNIRNLNYSLINRSDLVILNGLSSIDPSLQVILQNYLKANGDVLIIPNANADLSTYQSFIGQSISLQSNAGNTAISMPDVSNPFFYDIFESTEENFEMPQVRSLLSWQNDRSTLLQLRNGQKFLSVFGNNNNVYLMGSPLDDAFTNFHKHALFVPVMYRMASFSKESNSGMYASISDPLIETSADSSSRQQIYKLSREGEELIPAQRIAGNRLLLELPKFAINPGFYQLKTDEAIKDILAFNTDKNESRLEQYSQEEIKSALSIYKNITVFDADAESAFTKEMSNYRTGVPLWKYALILSLLFLLTEILIIRFL